MLRNWILQDLPHVLTQRSVQTLGTSSFHTNSTKNRKFWNLFEFSRKDNRKDVKKLSKQGDSPKNSKNNKLNDPSKSMFTMKSSNKVYSNNQPSNNEYTFRYIPRVKPRSKLSRSSINKPDELTSLLDGHLVPTNMKLKLKGYKSLRNEQSKDFAFVPGGKCLELDILPSQNEDGTIGVSYKFTELAPPKKLDKLKEVSPQETSYNELESHYTPFPIPITDYSSYTENKVTNTDDPKKSINKSTPQSRQDPAKSTLKQSETRAAIKDDTPAEQKESLTGSHDQDQPQTRFDSQNDPKQESRSMKNAQSSSAEASGSQEHPTQPSIDLSKENQASVGDNVSESRDTNVKKMDKDNTVEATESEIKSSSKMPRYGTYEPRIEQQRRSSSPCSTSFAKARENSTKQRWSGFDRPATGCCPGSSGSHGTGSQGSTRPYPPTVPTREASSKCYARERDPIVRSDIAGYRKMVKTRNSAASIATVNFAEARVKGERILLGSKSATGLPKISQTVAYGSCYKSSSSCKEKNACSTKRRGNCEDDEMIPGKVICTKPRRRNDCSRPKPCRVEKPCEKRFTCAEQPPPPRPSCKPKKKKKICKRYCCPSLQADDCLLKRQTCPPKRGRKCNNSNENDDDFDRPNNEDSYQRASVQKDPSCLPIKDCSNNNNESDNCGPIREICTTPRRCNKSRSSNRDDRDDDCLETETEYREICTKPRKKECCNSRRSSRRSNSCGNRRYHSETRPLRSSKSFVTIPMFDVSVVSLRPYQNDAVLRFYSCQSGRKPPACGQQEDPCKKKCQKPEPKCLNKKSANICGKPKEDNCSRMMSKSVCGKQEDPCGAKKVDPCAKKTENVCGKPKSDPCGSSKNSKEADRARLQRELQEMQQCKGVSNKCKTEKKKKTGLEKVVSPCKRNQKNKSNCNKFESIDDLDVRDVGLTPSRVELHDPSIGFWARHGYDSFLLNFAMKPDNIIVNRSFCTTRKNDALYENVFQYADKEELPTLVEVDPSEVEWDEESSSSEL